MDAVSTDLNKGAELDRTAHGPTRGLWAESSPKGREGGWGGGQEGLCTCLPPLVITSVNLYVTNALLPALSLALRVLTVREGNVRVDRDKPAHNVVIYRGPEVRRAGTHWKQVPSGRVWSGLQKETQEFSKRLGGEDTPCRGSSTNKGLKAHGHRDHWEKYKVIT